MSAFLEAVGAVTCIVVVVLTIGVLTGVVKVRVSRVKDD